jgi:hypothetical protein
MLCGQLERQCTGAWKDEKMARSARDVKRKRHSYMLPFVRAALASQQLLDKPLDCKQQPRVARNCPDSPFAL